MYKDSLGNTYSSLPKPKPTKGAKSSKGGKAKVYRNGNKRMGKAPRKGAWIQKVKQREAKHRNDGQTFQSYSC
jgi:hypothetical protein